MCTFFIPQDRDRRQWRFNRFYAVPNPFTSLEQYYQFTHIDLREMTKPLLRRELAKIRLRLLYDDKPARWILDRLEKVREALGE